MLSILAFVVLERSAGLGLILLMILLLFHELLSIHIQASLESGGSRGEP